MDKKAKSEKGAIEKMTPIKPQKKSLTKFRLRSKAYVP
jgi:hypothetical protein